MDIRLIFVILFALLCLGAGVYIALSRNLIYAALGLFVLLFGVAGLFALADAGFLAASQIVVYVGGILILLIFGIMLTRRNLQQEPLTQLSRQLPALMAVVLLAALMSFVFLSENWEKLPENPVHPSQTRHIGLHILSQYLLPFEVASVLLLVALVGAAYVARREPKS